MLRQGLDDEGHCYMLEVVEVVVVALGVMKEQDMIAVAVVVIVDPLYHQYHCCWMRHSRMVEELHREGRILERIYIFPQVESFSSFHLQFCSYYLRKKK